MTSFAASWGPRELFLAFAITFGVALLLVNPPMAINDEDVHLARIQELAEGRLITRVDAQGEYHLVPSALVALSERYTAITEPGAKPRVRVADLWQWLRKADGPERVRFSARAAGYAPICYVPQVVALWLLKPLQLNVLSQLYLARLASLLGYVALAWLAIGVSPALRWIIIVVAATPIALTQAAGVSADGTVIGLALVFFALAGRAMLTSDPLSPRQQLAMAGAAIALTLCKPVYLAVLVCAPALFWTQKQHRARTLLQIAGSAALAVGCVAAWAALQPEVPAGDGVNDVARQLEFLRSQPWALLQVAYRTLLVYGDNILSQSVLVRGRMSNMVRLSAAVAVALHLQLAFGLSFGSLRRVFPGSAGARKMAALWFGVCAVTIIGGVFAALYVCCTEVAGDRTRHLQGRYFLPAVPPLLMACALLGRQVVARWLRAGRGDRAFAILAFNGILCVFMLIGFHYFPASTQWPL